MAFFELTSRVTITQNKETHFEVFQMDGVHEVRIKRGMRGYRETAYIKLPSRARVIKPDLTSQEIIVADFFKIGDALEIELGYNGYLRSEFKGFIRGRLTGDIVELECDGYWYQLENKTLTANLSAGIKVKDLLELVCKGTDIKVQCTIDMTLHGRVLTEAKGTEVLDEIRSASGKTLTLFFIEPNVLWCGLVFTPYMAGTQVFDLPTVYYLVGHNTLTDDGLKQRIPEYTTRVIINGLLASGDNIRTTSDEKAAQRKKQFMLNGVRDERLLKVIANETANRENYRGYEGFLPTLLEPYCQPGWTAYVQDELYPDQAGYYLVESLETSFGVRGTRRSVGIGVQFKQQTNG